MINGFSIMAQGYRRLLDQGVISSEDAAKSVRIYEFLAECDKDDLYKLFDSSAFNGIVLSYVSKVCAELVDEAWIDGYQSLMMQFRVKSLISEVSSKDILNIL